MRTDPSAGLIYLDYHASTPVDPRVMEVMAPFHLEHFGNPHASDHAEGWRANQAVEAAASSVARALGVDPDEILFTSGATESNNLAVLGIARRAPPSRRRILVSSIEHKCVLAAARAATSLGFAVEQLVVNECGRLDLSHLEGRLGPDVLLVSVMAVNNEIGVIQDIAEISKLVRDCGAYMHTDAAQALATGPLRLASWDVDLLSLSGHKIYGPKGVGALVVRRHVQDHLEPLMYGGGQQGGLRPGTVPVPLCVGLAEAVELTGTSESTDERQRIQALRDRFVAKLQGMNEGVALVGPTRDVRHPGNANLFFPRIDARDLLAALQPYVAASTGSACTSGIPEPSHVLRAIGLNANEAECCVRFSIGRFTDEGEVDEAVRLISEAIPQVRSSAL